MALPRKAFLKAFFLYTSPGVVVSLPPLACWTVCDVRCKILSVYDNWDDDGLLAVIERRLSNQCRAGRSHTVTQALGTLAVTPLRRIHYYFSITGEGRGMAMHVLR